MIGRTDPRIARLGIARLQAAFDAGIGSFCLGGGKFDFVIPGGAWIARIAGATGAARIGRRTRVGCRAGVGRTRHMLRHKDYRHRRDYTDYRQQE